MSQSEVQLPSRRHVVASLGDVVILNFADLTCPHTPAFKSLAMNPPGCGSVPSGSLSASDPLLTQLLPSCDFFSSPPLHGHGLNLSTNNGLDLTRPNYEGLNLSVAAQQQQQQQFQPQRRVPRGQQQDQHQQQGLNLSQANPQYRQPQRYPQQPRGREVGLNLTVDHSQQHHQQQSSEQSSTSSHVLRKGNFFYTAQNCLGYVNLAPLSDSQQQKPDALERDDQRHSPLNLERQRSSPLNLTSAVPNGNFGHDSDAATNNNVGYDDYGVYHEGGGILKQQMYSCNFQSAGQQVYNDNYYVGGQQPAQGHQVQSGAVVDNNFVDEHNQAPHDASFHYCREQQEVQSAPNRVRLYCSSCCQEFPNSVALNKHLERHNNEGGNNMVQQQGVSSQRSIFAENGVCATATQADYNAQVCGPEETTYVNLTTTNRVARDCSRKSNPAAVPAEMSGIVSTTTNNSSKKRDLQHEPPESCLTCGLTFPTGVDLKKHLDLAHEGRQGANSFECPSCSQTFPDRTSLRRHTDESHASSENTSPTASTASSTRFICSECGARLANQTGLNRHIRRVHERLTPFACDECDKRFYDRHDLQRHAEAHAKANRVPDCAICGRGGFASEYKLRKHRCRPEGRFPCELCDCKLENKAAWGFHMWKHTKDTKYIDTECALEEEEGRMKKTEESGDAQEKSTSL